MITLTEDQLVEVFDVWEKDFRANPETFLTREECAAMETATLAQRTAITFKAFLRQVQTA